MTTLAKTSTLLVAAATLLTVSSASATTKSGSGTELTDGASWGGTAPTAADTAQWTGSSLGSGLSIASPVTWGALDFEGSTNAVGITGAGPLTLNGGQTINGIANSGLVVASTANGTTTTLGVKLELGANQTWTTDGAKTVTFSTTNTTDLKGFILDLNISGTASAQGALNNFNFNSASVKNGTINANAGTNVNFSQGGTGNYSLGTDLKINIKSGSFVRFNGSTSGTQITDYAAEVHLQGGTLLFSGGNATTPTLAATGKLIVDSNSTISTQSTGSGSPTTVIAAAISGTGNLNIAPTSNRATQNVILTNANSGYSGAWTLTAPGGAGPTLTVADGGALGDGGATNTVTLGTATTLAFTNTTGTLSVANAIGGAGRLTKSGAGTVKLSGSNTYTGGTAISGGILQVDNGSILANTGDISFAGTSTLTMANNAASTLTNNIVLGAPGSASTYNIVKNTAGPSAGTRLDISGTIGGGNANTTLFFNSNTAGDTTTNFHITGNNTFAGAVTLNRGYLVLGHNNALGTASVKLDGNGNASGDLQFDDTVTSVANNLNLFSTASNKIGGTAGGVSLSGIISGSNGLNKVGSGKLVLAGVNTYTGATTITAGTLTVAASGAIKVDNTGVTVASGATLAVNGTLTLTSGAATLVNNGGTISLDSTGSVLDLGSAFGGQGTGSTYDLIAGSTLTTTGTFKSILFTANANFDTVTFDNITGKLSFTLTAVPEPSTYGLIGAGTFASAALVHRRRKRALQAG